MPSEVRFTQICMYVCIHVLYFELQNYSCMYRYFYIFFITTVCMLIMLILVYECISIRGLFSVKYVCMYVGISLTVYEAENVRPYFSNLDDDAFRSNRFMYILRKEMTVFGSKGDPHIYIHIYIHTYLHTYIYTHSFIDIYTCMHILVSTSVYMYVYICF